MTSSPPRLESVQPLRQERNALVAAVGLLFLFTSAWLLASEDLLYLDGFENVPVTCGDGIVAPNEQCDDANSFDGDGCSASCEIEPGYQCSGQPSVCTML